MKTYYLLPIIWCLVSWTIQSSGQIVPFEENCIRLTISDSLVDLLEDRDSEVSSDEIAAPSKGIKSRPFWNGECLETVVHVGGRKEKVVEYNLIWNGQFDGDTAHVHFYFKDPTRVISDDPKAHEELAILCTLKKYFSLSEIIESSPYDKTYVIAHCGDFVNRYPLREIIEISTKRKN
jgi:hypothetical protein